MLYKQPTSFVDALTYTECHLAWVPEYHDTSLVIYRFYLYDMEEACYGLFTLREGRPAQLLVVTFGLRNVRQEMDRRYIPHQALDWKHAPPSGEIALTQLPYEEAKAMAKQWFRTLPPVEKDEGYVRTD